MAAKGNLKVIDLFSGAGGLSLGAARAGFSICCAVENDPHAIATHRLNFPFSLHLEKDVSNLTGTELKTAICLGNGDLAGIVGGPPCQGFSCMGKNDKDDPRNGLFVDFFRIVAETRPKFFLAENVPGIMNEDHKEIREKAFSQVENDYVLLPPMLVCAKDFGAPTTRTRVFFYGYRPDELEPLSEEDFASSKSGKDVCVKKALGGLPARISPKWQTEKEGWRVVRVRGKGYFVSRLSGHVPCGVGDSHALLRLKKENRVSGCLGTAHSEDILKRYAEVAPGESDSVSKSVRLSLEGFCPTLRAGTGPDHGSFQAVRPLHPTENRVITPREAARLQGFPDWFRFSPTKWHSFRQIGSSVSPILAERILTVVRKAFGDEKMQEG